MPRYNESKVMKMQAKNIKTLSFGCRLNALETEKIQKMLSPHMDVAIIVNSCAVTTIAEKQSIREIHKIIRENPGTPVFITGCAATNNPSAFDNIPAAFVIPNSDKLKLSAYLSASQGFNCATAQIQKFGHRAPRMSKQYIQIQNGCNHDCSYCITRILRGKNISFDYSEILESARAAIKNGFFEIVLTGIDIASFVIIQNGAPMFLSDLCKSLLQDVPEIQRLRLSSMDPASKDIPKIIDLMMNNTRMMPHLHLSMQSGSDCILKAMRRRHSTENVREIMANKNISFSWDIICGFPGETDSVFTETAKLAKELAPIKIHAFSFSARAGTAAFDLPDRVNTDISRNRVKIITDIADANKKNFMQSKIGTKTSVLVELNNVARTPDDIDLIITGAPVQSESIINVSIDSISRLHFIGKIC